MFKLEFYYNQHCPGLGQHQPGAAVLGTYDGYTATDKQFIIGNMTNGHAVGFNHDLTIILEVF